MIPNRPAAFDLDLDLGESDEMIRESARSPAGLPSGRRSIRTPAGKSSASRPSRARLQGA
jgi:hypothetical protein